MKTKLTILILSLATCGLVTFAQENNSKPAGPASPPETPPAPEVTPAPPSPEAPAPATPAPVVPPAEAPVAPAPVVPSAPGPELAAAPAAPAAPSPVAAAPVAAAAPDAVAPAPAAAPSPNEVVPLIVIEEVPLTDAIRNLARQSNLNFQFDPRVMQTNQPNVSIRFENVTAQEALNAVLENYNLTLQRDPKSKIARVSIKDPKAEDPLVSRIVQIRYSDPTNLVLLVKSTLSPRSSVVSDGRTSQLIINTTEKEIDGVINLITKLDSPTKQVLIEARLYETSKAPSSIKGIDWSGTVGAQKVTFGNNGLPGVAATGPTTALDANGNPTTVPGSAGSIGGILSDPKLLMSASKGSFFSPATAFLNADGVSAVVSFLNKDADTEVVATPRAVTLDNQMATLSVTRAFPVFQVTPGSANSPAGASVTYTNLGTILSVTPRIAADKNISLKVIPEVSNIDSVDKQTLNGQVNTANIYAVRRMDTQVMIPSGSTLVMGGMISDTHSKSYIKVPLLGDLPFIGAAFRQKGDTRNKSNLLIFITPTIVEDGDFQLADSAREFLGTRFVEKREPAQSAWNSAKPVDWTKPAN